MRIPAALLLPLVVFGGIFAYSQFLASLPAANEARSAPTRAAGKFSVEATLTCDLQEDAFSIGEAVFQLRHAGRDLLRRDKNVAANETLRADDVSGLVEGDNTFFVRAVPAPEAMSHANAVRVRILRDDRLLAENTFWSAPGDVVSGELTVHIPADKQPESHE